MMESPKYTCLKLDESEPIFVKGTWYPTRFDLSITDGQRAWTYHATEEDVEERASQWDQPVSEYIDLAEKYLGFQQPGSVYGFSDAGNGYRRLTWTFEKEGTKLEWRWKCQPSPDSKKTTSDVLDFLMDANIRLSEEVVRKTQLADRLGVEAERCLAQSEKLSNEKAEFENEIYGKVLNSKKAKLRELRDRLSKQATANQLQEEDEQSTDKTESFDVGTDEGNSDEERGKNDMGTSMDVPANRARGRKRK